MSNSATATMANSATVNGSDYTSASSKGVTKDGTAATFQGTTDYNAKATYTLTGLDKAAATGKNATLTLNWDPFPTEQGMGIDYSGVYLTNNANPSVGYSVGFAGAQLEDAGRFINGQGELIIQITLTYNRKLGTLNSISFDVDES